MKKSHRKDVIIARIIFAAVLILLIAIIVGAVLLIRGHMAGQHSQDSQVMTENTEEIQQPADDTQNSEPVIETEESQEPEPNPVLQTTTGVNLRKEPSTESEVLTVLQQGTMLELLGEEDGWAVVDYQGQIGYVKLDYLQEVM